MMDNDMSVEGRQAFAALESCGLLLLQDKNLPNLAGLIAGAPVRGSWWGHPRADAIYRAAGELGSHASVEVFKLVNAKVTYVHRQHWPAIMLVGAARERWQLDGLSSEARALLDRVDRAGQTRATGPAAKELEIRLLVVGQNVHTESGSHAKELRTWTRFARDRGVDGMRQPVADAKAALEDAARRLAAVSGARVRLPWS